MRYAALTFLLLGGMTLAADKASAQAPSPIRLLENATVTTDGAPTVDVTPVRVGWGWRGPGWYPGGYRPYGSYYRPYRGYYGGYGYPGRYYSGYRGGYYGSPYWR